MNSWGSAIVPTSLGIQVRMRRPRLSVQVIESVKT
jgi:hypothetical protein